MNFEAWGRWVRPTGLSGCVSPPSRVVIVVSWTMNLPEDRPAAARGLGSSGGALRPSVSTTECGGGETCSPRSPAEGPAGAGGRRILTAQATLPEPGTLPRSFGVSEADARGAPKGRQSHSKVTSFSTVPSRPRVPRIVWGLRINVGDPAPGMCTPQGRRRWSRVP